MTLAEPRKTAIPQAKGTLASLSESRLDGWKSSGACGGDSGKAPEYLGESRHSRLLGQRRGSALSARVMRLDRLYLKADAALTAWLQGKGTRAAYLRARRDYDALVRRPARGRR